MKRNNIGKNTVLITGITGGLGRVIAEALAQRGFNIVGQFNSASSGEAGKLKRSLESFKIQVELIASDFSDSRSAECFIRKLGRRPILNLINNAGGLVVNREFTRVTMRDLEAVMRVNFYVPFLITQKLFSIMRRAGYGRVVNISSIAAKYGGSMSSLPYGSAKRALEGLTRTLTRAGAAHDILINNIRPGVIDTPFHQRYPKDMNARMKLIPLGRMGTPEDIARAVLFLIDGNAYVTGQTITVAGGE